MRVILVDTNAWLRYLLKDIDSQYTEMESIMKKMKKGEVCLRITDEVMLEICFVLKSFYKLEPSEISKALSNLILVNGIEVDSIWKTVLTYYGQINLSLIDILLKCKAKTNKWELFTFDEKLKKVMLK